MSTEAQISANQANSQHSTGPRTEEGKLASCMNNFRFGFTGAFRVLPDEDELEFEALRTGLLAEHRPATQTERLLVDGMAEHYWLKQRAITLQNECFTADLSPRDFEKRLALYMRYQTTNDRGFSKCLNDLLKLRAEKRKERIGFDSQKRQEAEQARKQSVENRKLDVHRMDVLLAEAKVDHQLSLTHSIEYATAKAMRDENRLVSEAKAA